MHKPTVCAVALNVTAWSAMNSLKNQSPRRKRLPKKRHQRKRLLRKRLLRKKQHLRKRHPLRKQHPPRKLLLRKPPMSPLLKLPLKKLLQL